MSIAMAMAKAMAMAMAMAMPKAKAGARPPPMQLPKGAYGWDQARLVFPGAPCGAPPYGGPSGDAPPQAVAAAPWGPGPFFRPGFPYFDPSQLPPRSGAMGGPLRRPLARAIQSSATRAARMSANARVRSAMLRTSLLRSLQLSAEPVSERFLTSW